jgi:hypothetical protein
MNNIKVEVEGLKVKIKQYPREIDLKFSTQFELDVFLLQLVFAELEVIE